ncbi:hypothetical protein BDY24DRAFT_381186 [Mrakia frigida]|uniref:kinetochore Spc24 family protein n=1 Tax=Mrakia frigida TaxID=29902 RepID=UPI003FCBFB52
MSASDSWTEPIPVLRNVIPLMSTAEDIEFVTETDRTMREREEERSKEFDSVQQDLRVLSRKLKSSQSQAVRKANHPSEQQHRETVQQLDKSKFALGKNINEKQTASAKMENELEMLKEEFEELTREKEDWNRGGTEADELDGEALRLKLNHSLGYSLIRSNDAPHEPTKILVRNDAVPNVQSLPLPTEEDDQKRAEFADRLWALTEAA